MMDISSIPGSDSCGSEATLGYYLATIYLAFTFRTITWSIAASNAGTTIAACRRHLTAINNQCTIY